MMQIILEYIRKVELFDLFHFGQRNVVFTKFKTVCRFEDIQTSKVVPSRSISNNGRL